MDEKYNYEDYYNSAIKEVQRLRGVIRENGAFYDNCILLLKAAEVALNACPMHKISHEDFKTSYEVVEAIEKFLREENGGNEDD